MDGTFPPTDGTFPLMDGIFPPVNSTFPQVDGTFPPVDSTALGGSVRSFCSRAAAVTAAPAAHCGPSGRGRASRLPSQCHSAHAPGPRGGSHPGHARRWQRNQDRAMGSHADDHVPPSLGRRDSGPSMDTGGSRPSCFVPLFHRVLMVRWQLGWRTCCWGGPATSRRTVPGDPWGPWGDTQARDSCRTGLGRFSQVLSLSGEAPEAEEAWVVQRPHCRWPCPHSAG